VERTNSMSTPRTFGSEMALGPVARELPTAREMQVLQLICDGCATKEIAARLGISFKTVVCHRYRLMEKADVHSSIGLFRWGIKNGFVSL